MEITYRQILQDATSLKYPVGNISEKGCLFLCLVPCNQQFLILNYHFNKVNLNVNLESNKSFVENNSMFFFYS